MTIAYTQPPAPADLLRLIGRLPEGWQRRFSVLSKRMATHLAARQTLSEWHVAEHEDHKPTDMANTVQLIGGAS